MVAVAMGSDSPGLTGAAPLRVAVLIACHNRRESTLGCLTALRSTAVAAGAVASLQVFLVDDGSSDGTAAAVRERFPDVRVIAGDGSLFWCGGMRLAWLEAARGDFDAYLWLNDDVTLEDGAISRLIATLVDRQRVTGSACIVVGATRHPDQGGVASYGALIGAGVAPLSDDIRRIQYFNGNVVMVSRDAFRILGPLSADFTHGFGDVDYGVRARRAGVPVWLAAGGVGRCASNGTPLWQRPDVPLWRRLRELHRPTGCPPWQLARLIWRNGGWWFPWSILKLYLRAIFPPRVGGRP